ncbi:MAG: hypothetical protein GYB35_03275 [Algicola sp.]|nr:hypothetical protein [Algicola sp.]
MNSFIKYDRKLPFWKLLLGLLALLIGFYGLYHLEFFMLIPILLGLMLLKTEGSEINLDSKTYRKTVSILGITLGKWHKFNNPEYVSIFSTTEDVTLRALTAETTNSYPIIVLNIFYERNKKITVYKTEDIKDAISVASRLADALFIDVLDATKKGDFKWVDKDILREKGEIKYTD